MRCLPTFFAMAGVTAALLSAPVAAAEPKCVDTGPTTTQCSTPGHTQIVTSPAEMNNYPWYGGGWPIFGWGIGW